MPCARLCCRSRWSRFVDYSRLAYLPMSLAHMLNRNPMAKAMVPVLPHFYLESSVFPASPLGSGLRVRHLRCLHPDAHVWPLGVVEAYDPLQFGPAFLAGGYAHLVQPFRLQYAVGASRHGVLERVSALGHADAYPVPLQFRHIRVAAVLASPVRVVDQTARRILVYCREGHLQGLERVYGLKCGT